MKIKFHGPLGEVTGSCYELQSDELGVHFLVDYGMKQGVSDADDWNLAAPPFDPSLLDFVLLTHAHLDHCGLLPVLYRQGFRGRVICTKETAELATINLMDACRHNAPFDEQDVTKIKWWEPPSRPLLNRAHYVAPDVAVTFRRTAHILGAVSVKIGWGPTQEWKEITFSGDIGNNTAGKEFQPLMRHREDPMKPRSCKSYVVMESTYGGRAVSCEDKDFGARINRLRTVVKDAVIDRRGTLVIPCFAIGRTQALLFDLTWLFAHHREFAEIPVLLDAPMAGAVNSVYARGLQRFDQDANGRRQPMWLSKQLVSRCGLRPNDPEHQKLVMELVATALGEASLDPARLPKTLRNWRQIWRAVSSFNGLPEEVGGPAIVISGGGMCSGGPVGRYLHQLLTDPKSTVMLTGHCSADSVGGQLLRISSNGPETNRSVGVLRGAPAIPEADVNAEIGCLSGYSGHADHNGLVDWFFGQHRGKPYPAAWTTFLTHGTDDRRRKLVVGLKERARELEALAGWNASDLKFECPRNDCDWYDLDLGKWLSDSAAVLRAMRPMWRRLNRLQRCEVIEELMADI